VNVGRRPRGVSPVAPGPGQESVWDYPRPARLEPTSQHLVVELAGRVIAETRDGFRVLETSHPPGYYIPREDWADGVLRPTDGSSFCEWKGNAIYYDVVVGDRTVTRGAWGYPAPTPPFAALAHCVSVYPGQMDRCSVDGMLVTPQAGEFYGGWITDLVVGPFKGEPGTWGW
jgi:uncharacterized protein (DUF427 family)